MKKKKRSLKAMLIKLFLIGPFLVIVCVIGLSFHTISSLMTNKIEITIQDNLSRFSSNIEASMNNLNKVVYQFTDGIIGDAITRLEYASAPYEKARLSNQIREQIELITFTHNDLHVITLYQKEDRTFLYPNETINESYDLESFPILSTKNQFIYYSPHVSIDKYIYDPVPVISLFKRIPNAKRKDLYIYIEANFDYLHSGYETELFNQNDFFAITDKEEKVIFSSDEDVLKVGASTAGNSVLADTYYTYGNAKNQDYNVLYLVPKYEYNLEKFTWISQVFLLVLAFAAFTTFSILFLWRNILRPIEQAEEEIKWISKGNLDTVPRHTGVVEFDSLIEEIIIMKSKLSGLIQRENDHKNRQAQLEIEKLLYQINPHFLMNSLNTIYWMAALNDQTEIGKNVQALINLLQYNLKHDTIMVPLRDEVNALKQYLLLQKTRYNFEYAINCDMDSGILDYLVPRFILQPLVENSIYHGLSDENGRITVTITKQEDLSITVHDNGQGIPKAAVEKLLETQDTGKGSGKMGIGISYVLKILKSRYRSRAFLNIESDSHSGTTITMHIPVTHEVDD